MSHFFWFLVFLSACHVKSPSTAEVMATPSSKTWVFLDLGNTLIDTTDFTKQHYMPGAKDYLKSLHIAGFAVGIILNIPEDWGTTGVGKFSEIVRFVDGKRRDAAPHAQWADAVEFDWNDFDEGGVIFPYKNDERKPKPNLFRKAMQIAGPCGMLFQGEEAPEIATADGLGLAAYQVGQPGRDFYLPVQKIKSAVRAKISNEDAQQCAGL